MPQDNWGDTVKVAGAMVGGVIGAGFASGREIVSFFAPLRSAAWLGIGAAALVLAAGGWAVVAASALLGVRDYGGLFRASAGRRAGSLIDAAVTGFLLLTASVTLAGGGALLEDFYGVPGPAGLLATAVGAALLVRRGHASLFSGSSVLAPLLVLCILIIVALPGVGGRAVPHVPQPGAGTPTPGTVPAPGLSSSPGPTAGPGWTPWLEAVSSGLLYGAYNLILGSGILVAGARYRATSGALAGALAGGTVLGLLAAAVLRGCLRGGEAVLTSEIPVAVLAMRLPAGGFHLFAMALALAAVTTLGAVAASLAERCGPVSRAAPHPTAPLFVVLAIPVATLGFSRLVQSVYPALGLLGLFWLGLWAISWPRQE